MIRWRSTNSPFGVVNAGGRSEMAGISISQLGRTISPIIANMLFNAVVGPDRYYLFPYNGSALHAPTSGIL